MSAGAYAAEQPIWVDTTPATVNVVSVSRSKISDKTGFNTQDVIFAASEPFTQYEIYIVNGTNVPRGGGTLLEAGPPPLSGASVPVNEVIDPSFDRFGLMGWVTASQSVSGTTFNTSTAWSDSGTYSLFIDANVTAANGYFNGIHPIMPCLAGETYSWRVAVRPTAMPAGAFAIASMEWLQGTTSISFSAGTSVSTVGVTGVSSGTAVAPANADGMRLTLRVVAGATTGIVGAYFDSLMIVRGSTVPGSFYAEDGVPSGRTGNEPLMLRTSGYTTLGTWSSYRQTTGNLGDNTDAPAVLRKGTFYPYRPDTTRGFIRDLTVGSSTIQLTFDDVPAGTAGAKMVRAWFFGDTNGNGQVMCRFLTGATLLAQRNMPTNQASSWRSTPPYFGVLTEAQLNDLRVEFVSTVPTASEYATISALYVEVWPLYPEGQANTNYTAEITYAEAVAAAAVEGANTLGVYVRDRAGNWSSLGSDTTLPFTLPTTLTS